MTQEAFVARLQAELAGVATELETVAVKNIVTGDWEPVPAEPAETSDLNITADTVEESEQRQAIVAELEIRFRNIARALEKAADGTFGSCEICNQEIEMERLEVNPAARTCIADKERESELLV
jgi:RNA polymerase-binding transcription factor DksA